MIRKPGRPRTAMNAMDAALFGQLRTVVLEMDARNVPWHQMAEQLAARTGVRVHPKTVATWTKEFKSTRDADEGR